MSIIRDPHKTNFTVINNDYWRNTNLTLDAKGILTAMVTKPDRWHRKASAYASELGISLSRVYKAINNLIDHGYITREITKDSKGLIKCMEYTVIENPRSHSGD